MAAAEAVLRDLEESLREYLGIQRATPYRERLWVHITELTVQLRAIPPAVLRPYQENLLRTSVLLLQAVQSDKELALGA